MGTPLKVLTVFGTRPEAIKVAPVIQRMRAEPERFACRVCVTGQHRQMLDQVLELFGLQPDYDLNVMVPDQTLSYLTSQMLAEVANIIGQEKPDWVLVQGDTTTTLTASLAAYYARIPVAHIEAGLRSGDPWRPYPEEINRRAASAMASLHFAPTETARQNLLAEGVPEARIRVTGNTVIDALLDVAARPYDFSRSPLSGLPLDSRRIILVTAHRRESFGGPLRNLCLAIRGLAERYPDDVHVVYPVHLNPNVQQPVREILGARANISLLEPLPYEPFVHLMQRSTLILTDSGGVQEEAPSLGVPVLVMRDVTERPEGVAAGAARLVGTDPEKIVAAATELLDNPGAYQRMAQVANPYGDGRASERILAALLEFPRDPASAVPPFGT
ncbi:MAG: UDP-N-acetylglucosamine 2-epimerase (non-hydrolyzing) [Acidobacteria bacterium]|nr:UDP-N-acetylglucosamine 2-epimerase (non-hydrolyzing) [Acidobacteriota bacterium]